MKIKKSNITREKRYMYIGPNLRKNHLKNGQVFIGEENSIFEEISKLDSSLKKLYVEVNEELSKRIIKCKREGTAENIIYKKIEEWVKGGER